MQKVLFVLALVIIPLSSMSQNKNTSEQIMQRATEQISEFYNYWDFLKDRNMSLSQKEPYYKATLSLFVGEGEAYMEDGVQKQGITIEITSAKVQTKRCMLLKAYLKRIMKGVYEPIVIKSVGIPDKIDIATLRQIDKDLYVCIGYKTRLFAGGSEETDTDGEAIKLYLRKIEGIYVPLLGDLKAVSENIY